jgi:gamma-aminobutyric acid receptor subunit alpha
VSNGISSQDNSLRPNFGNKPAVIEIDLMVRSMGPVSEIEMVIFSLDLVKLFLK